MQRQVTLHFISLKNTISRLEKIEPLVTFVPLSRLEQVVVLDMLALQLLWLSSPRWLARNGSLAQVSLWPIK